jgi:hypothetical protein
MTYLRNVTLFLVFVLSRVRTQNRFPLLLDTLYACGGESHQGQNAVTQDNRRIYPGLCPRPKVAQRRAETVMVGARVNN